MSRQSSVEKEWWWWWFTPTYICKMLFTSLYCAYPPPPPSLIHNIIPGQTTTIKHTTPNLIWYDLSYSCINQFDLEGPNRRHHIEYNRISQQKGIYNLWWFVTGGFIVTTMLVSVYEWLWLNTLKEENIGLGRIRGLVRLVGSAIKRRGGEWVMLPVSHREDPSTLHHSALVIVLKTKRQRCRKCHYFISRK